jgi:hypothetical protein
MNWRLTGKVAACVAIFFAGWSLTGVLADIAAFRAGAWVEAWSFQMVQAQARQTVFVPPEADWQEAEGLGQLAVRLSPLNADYHEKLARVYEARFMMLPPGTPEAKAVREKAVIEYREAIRLRPTWPYAHSALAYALVRTGGHDLEVETALAEASRLGPWEPQVMEAVVDIGLDGWYRISPASRKVVSETLLRSQSWMAGEMGRQHADRVWARVEAHRKQALVCAMLPMKDERNRQRCNAATWK